VIHKCGASLLINAVCKLRNVDETVVLLSEVNILIDR